MGVDPIEQEADIDIDSEAFILETLREAVRVLEQTGYIEDGFDPTLHTYLYDDAPGALIEYADRKVRGEVGRYPETAYKLLNTEPPESKAQIIANWCFSDLHVRPEWVPIHGEFEKTANSVISYEEFLQDIDGTKTPVTYIAACPECHSTRLTAQQVIEVDVERFVRRASSISYDENEENKKNPYIERDTIRCRDCHFSSGHLREFAVAKSPADGTTQSDYAERDE